VQFEPMLYNIIWVGLNANLLPNLKLFTEANRKLNSIDDHLDRAADVETEPEKYDKQQQKPLGESSGPGSRKPNYRPTFSEMKDIPKNPSKPDKCEKLSSSGKDLPPSPCVTIES